MRTEMSEPDPGPDLPPQAGRSLTSVLIVQAQNAFNDNFVKLVLIGLAVTVAAGTPIGENIQFILAALIPIPFILLAPVAGWFSDRYAKSRVIYVCLIAQVLIFALIAMGLVIQSVQLAIFGYFLLAVQSTLFSPAKQGILKELVGSKKLGTANGLMQMLTMAGILGGMASGGEWFDVRLAEINGATETSTENAWSAALIPVLAIGAVSLIPLVLGLFIRRTPSHDGHTFHSGVFGSHFRDLGYLFKHPILRRTGLLIAFYWLVANFLALSFFGFAIEMNPNVAEGGVSSASSRMFMAIGAGLIVGSLLVSFITRNGNRIALSIPGAIGMAMGLVGIGLFESGSQAWFGAIIAVGFASGFYIVPLNAHLQDRIEESHRGRVLSAQNLMGSFCGILAIGTSKLMAMANMKMSAQVLAFVVPMLAVGILIAVIKRDKLDFPKDETS